MEAIAQMSMKLPAELMTEILLATLDMDILNSSTYLRVSKMITPS